MAFAISSGTPSLPRGTVLGIIFTSYKCDFSFKFARRVHCQSLFACAGKELNELDVFMSKNHECASSIKLTSKLLSFII